MKIQYLGHSCFVLTESTGTTVITDPYNSIGFKLPKASASVVTVSHQHYDHNNVAAVEGKPLVIDKEGSHSLDGVDITGIKSFHDDEGGTLRGENLIFKFRMDGLDVCHLGDIGEMCTAELLEQILPIDVLLIPVGGKYTINSEQAKEYVDRIMPEIVIPMHYKIKGLKMDISKPDDFLDLFEDEEVEYCEDNTLEFFRDDLTGEQTKVIMMERFKH
ncbi:MAG: MBL fold metallo-hydrolase [Clostridia bacterium]|nr:MBL fold metallo-hydrolase [Clostridia bacterium]